jgi:shikimate dehydrogenase
MSQPYAEVIGDPIAHSKSPAIHRFWLKKLGIDGDFRATRVPAEDIAAFIEKRSADHDWRGCNVTIPHKIAVMDHVGDPGDVRDSIGAMNTILRAPDGIVTGTNTDAGGFYVPIAGLPLEGEPVAIIGTGGAAHAVLFALSRLGVGPVTILARNPFKAIEMISRFKVSGSILAMAAPLPPVALLVNTTQLGMEGQPPLDLDLSPLPDHAVVYDIVYAPLETGLLKAARARGLETVDGLEMLIGQAALAFELFFGKPAPREHDDELRALLVA